MSFYENTNPDTNPMYGDKYIEYCKQLRAFADTVGIKCNQAHAPFGSSFGDAEKDEIR